MLLSGLVLLAVSATFSQNATAAVFFDSAVMFRWKADPQLRTTFASNQTAATIDVLVVFPRILSAQERAILNDLGRVGSYTGHVATLTLTREALQRLAIFDFVQSISYPKEMKTQLDMSVPEIGANRVWNTTEFEGIRDGHGDIVNGTGIIIGIADSGIDYTHRDFFYPNGTNKILYIWDQTIDDITEKNPAGFSYGWECTPDEIAAESCPETDGSSSLKAGHGTAVASVAASTGQATGRYQGVAPGASIVAVKLKRASENYVLDSLSYIVDKAKQLGRPVVIEHSMGNPLGSHDGQEALDLAFSDFVNSGVPIVVSAGNSGDLNLHVSGMMQQGASVTVPWVVNKNQGGVAIDIWYPTTSTFTAFVTTPRGTVVSGATVESGSTTADGRVVILYDKWPRGNEIWIEIESINSEPLAQEGWSFTLTGLSVSEQRWDAWIDPGQFSSNHREEIGYKIDTSMTIDSPGNAFGVITVGAYTTKWAWWARCTPCIQWAIENNRKGWAYFPGKNQGFPTPDDLSVLVGVTDYFGLVGKVAYFSSMGPTRDGRTKPEITAPGMNIAYARASTKGWFVQDPDDYHAVGHGTSLSAPHVAGVIALMLQMNPYLTPNQIREILTDDARSDRFTGPIDRVTGSPVWGWGKVDAFASTRDAKSLYSVKLEFAPIGNLSTKVTVDGNSTFEVNLNRTNQLVLEFKAGVVHSVEITKYISASEGARYALYENTWNFSSGSAKTIVYRLQYYLDVESSRGYATGSGWYDANSTATAAVGSTFVEGYEFQGWAGAVNSTNSSVQIEMDSSKHITAVWKESSLVGPAMFEALPFIIVAAAFAVLIPIGVYFYRARRVNSTHR